MSMLSGKRLVTGVSRGISRASALALAASVAFIAGPESSYITGSNLTVDGGMNVLNASVARVAQMINGNTYQRGGRCHGQRGEETQHLF